MKPNAQAPLRQAAWKNAKLVGLKTPLKLRESGRSEGTSAENSHFPCHLTIPGMTEIVKKPLSSVSGGSLVASSGIVGNCCVVLLKFRQIQ